MCTKEKVINMSFIDIWNTPEGRYMFSYCFACMVPLLALAVLVGMEIQGRET